MKGLRGFVAEAIERDQMEGGAGILTDEEMKALEWAIMAPLSGASAFIIAEHEQAGHAKQYRTVLAGLAGELGPSRLHLSGFQSRADKYWIHCADVAIAAYDEWLEQKAPSAPAAGEGL